MSSPPNLASRPGLSAGLPADEATLPGEALPQGRVLPRRDRSAWRDYAALGKPMITLLLLATTWAGMVVAGGGLPPASLTFWTLLGGGLTAAGASALNQFIDR
ncbi:MAG TPA: hypothetical protein VK449_02505, partial [Anaerolineales bacterium]|nr:hypothetical protein [Anaerolineales bacterium]